MRIEDIKDPVQRAMFAKAAGIPTPGILPRPTMANPGCVILPMKEKQESPLEALFLSLWERAGGPLLEREVKIVPDREFRSDFVHELSKTIIEIQGFRDHTTAKGFHRDNEKHWMLAKLGYTIITWDRKLINEANVLDLIKLVSI